MAYKGPLKTYRVIKGTPQYDIMKKALDGFPSAGFETEIRTGIPEMKDVHIGSFTGRVGSTLITFYSKDDLDFPWLKQLGKKKGVEV